MIDRCRNCGKPRDQAIQHDWDAVCVHCGQLLWLRPGDVAECKVTRLTPFGIIVELGDGVEGLVHITELAGQSIRHPEEVVGVGSLMRAQVFRVDVSEKRIGLSRRRLAL
jgi:ribosomal protein S1